MWWRPFALLGYSRRANMDRRGGGGPSQSREDEFLIDDHFVKTGAWNFRDRKMFKGEKRAAVS